MPSLQEHLAAARAAKTKRAQQRQQTQQFGITWRNSNASQTIVGYPALMELTGYALPSIRSRISAGKGVMTIARNNPEGMEDLMVITRINEEPEPVLPKKLGRPSNRARILNDPATQTHPNPEEATYTTKKPTKRTGRPRKWLPDDQILYDPNK